MAKSITDNTKKRGRPVTTGKGTLIGVRMLDRQLLVLDQWIAMQRDLELSRPEAIRRLVEIGLSSAKPVVPRRRVESVASGIDRASDPGGRRRKVTK